MKRGFWPLAAMLTLLIVPLVAEAQAAGTVNPSTLSWLEPQTNTDGSNLIDLASYRIEVATSCTGAFSQWGGTVPAVNANPVAGSRVTIARSTRPPLADTCISGTPPVAGACQYCGRLVAIDIMGNVGPPSNTVPFELRDAVAPGAPSDGRADP